MVLKSDMFVLSSKFGYIVMGKYNSDTHKKALFIMHCLCLQMSTRIMLCEKYS